MDEPTEKQRRYWDLQAGKYDREMGVVEFLMFRGERAWACSLARGDVLEVAIGTGLNLPHYPADARLTGVELSGEMLEVARRRQRELLREVDLRVGDAQALDLPDESFDTVVCTYALCTIPDVAKSVSEMHRVLRPGGQLILLDHVGSSARPLRKFQRFIERFSVKQGEYLTRNPFRDVRAAGFEVEQLKRTKAGIVQRLVARKPATLAPSAN